MDQGYSHDSPQSMYHTFQLFDQESSHCLFLLKSTLEQLSDSFSKKNPRFNIIENINESFARINNDTMSTTNDHNTYIQSENSYVSGFPGTQLDSFSPISQALKQLGEYSDSLRKITNLINEFLYQTDNSPEKKQSKKKQKKSRDSNLSDDLNEKKGKMVLIYNSIMGIKELLTTLGPEKEKKAQKILKKIDEKITNDHCKPTTASRLLSELNEIRLNTEKLELLKKLDEFYAQFIEHIPDVIKSFCVRYKFIKKIIKKLKKRNDKLINNLDPFISEIAEKASEINYENDFMRFVTNKKIIRYDLKCEPFKPVDMTHPVFSHFDPSKIINIVAVPPVYPIAMAKVLTSFTATDLNEITIVKGKMVLIMEPLDYPWVFVMNPFTNQTGFVPSMNLEVIGSALGVVTNEALSMDGINLLVGEYVAILKMKLSKNTPYLTQSPNMKRRKSSLKRTKNNSACSSLVFDSISNYYQSSNADQKQDNENKQNQGDTTNNNNNSSVKDDQIQNIEVEYEYSIEEEEISDNFIERLDDGMSRTIATVMGEKTKADLENVGLIYD